MKLKFIYWIVISMTIFSCYSKDNIPSNIIKPDKMKSILWDVMRSQTLASEMAFKDSAIDVAIQTKELTKKTFEIHKTDSAQFNESYNWYVKHPLVLKTIFDSLYAQKQRENRLNLKREISEH